MVGAGVEVRVANRLVLHAQHVTCAVPCAGLARQRHQRGVGHGMVDVVDPAHPVTAFVAIQRLHGTQGLGLQCMAQEGQQPAGHGRDVCFAVELRIGLHLQPHAAGIGGCAHVEVQVFHRPGAVHCLVGIEPGLAVRGVEGQDVQQRAVNPSLAPGPGEVAAHLFAAIAPVPPGLLQLAGGAGDQLVQWLVLADVQHQRHDVHHGGHAAGADVAQPAHVRHAGHHGLAAGVALHPGCHQQREDVGPAHQRLLLTGTQRLQHVVGYIDLGMQGMGARAGAAFGQAGHGVQRRQGCLPVPGILTALFAAAVAGVIGHHRGKGCQGRALRAAGLRGIGGHRLIVLHGPLFDQRHAIAVGRQMVHPLEPQHAPGLFDQQVPCQRLPARVDGGLQVGAHQPFCPAGVGRFIRQRHPLQNRLARGIEILPGAIVGIQEGQRQRIGLLQRGLDGRGQPCHIHRTTDFRHMAGVEDRIVRIELLRIPQPLLRLGQRLGGVGAVHAWPVATRFCRQGGRRRLQRGHGGVIPKSSPTTHPAWALRPFPKNRG